jgi:hypothetical protein
MKGGSICNGRMKTGVGVKKSWRVHAGILPRWREDLFPYSNG